MTVSTQTVAGLIPQWTLGDRMKKAREHAGLSQSALSATAGIGRTAIVSYETDKIEPPRPAMLAWSMATGVPYEWICHGDMRPCDYRPRGIPAGQGIESGSRSRSNYMQSNSTGLIAQRLAA